MGRASLYTLGMFVLANALQADPSPICTLSTLNGAYAVQKNGHTTTGGLVSVVGVVTFDGQGKAVGRQEVSRNGVFTKEQIASSYTVNADCTGTINSAAGEVSMFLIVHDADEVLGISMVSGNNEAVHYQRVGDGPAERPPVCTLATFTGTYGFQRNGHVSAGDLLALGILSSDGKGNATATQTIDRNGVFSVATFPATYTIDADCMGTQVDTNGNVFAAFVMVHGGSEVLGISQTPGNNVVIHFERLADPPKLKRCREDPALRIPALP